MDTYCYDTERIGKWFMEKTGKPFYGYRCKAIEQDGELKAAILCDRFGLRECQMHIYSEKGFNWMQTARCREAFEFVFNYLRRERITCETPVSHRAMLRMNEYLGFVREGVKRGAADDGGDAVIFGMLREECRWIKD